MRFEDGAKVATRVVEAGHDGADWDFEDFCDRGVFEFFDVPQDDDLSVFAGDLFECCPELALGFFELEFSGRLECAFVGEVPIALALDLGAGRIGAAAPVLRDEVEAGVAKDAEEPGCKRLPVAEAIQVLVDPEEGFLGEIASVVAVADVAHGHADGASHVTFDERFEASMVTMLGS